MSVSIVFDKFPTKEQIQMLKDRAFSFPDAFKKFSFKKDKITITGIRLIEESTTRTNIKI